MLNMMFPPRKERVRDDMRTTVAPYFCNLNENDPHVIPSAVRDLRSLLLVISI